MKITMETDYAVRIIYCLADGMGVMDARQICEQTGVSFRFALKILRKLCQRGIVKSYRGVNGGYRLQKEPCQITLLMVFEATEGGVSVSRCLEEDRLCEWVADKHECPFYNEMKSLNDTIKQTLSGISFETPAIREEKTTAGL